MKNLVFVVLCLIVLSTATVMAASLNFQATLPSASQGTLGVNQQLEINKAAITEIRTKMQNWATFSGYSAGTTR